MIIRIVRLTLDFRGEAVEWKRAKLLRDGIYLGRIAPLPLDYEVILSGIGPSILRIAFYNSEGFETGIRPVYITILIEYRRDEVLDQCERDESRFLRTIAGEGYRQTSGMIDPSEVPERTS